MSLHKHCLRLHFLWYSFPSPKFCNFWIPTWTSFVRIISRFLKFSVHIRNSNLFLNNILQCIFKVYQQYWFFNIDLYQINSLKLRSLYGESLMDFFCRQSYFLWILSILFFLLNFYMAKFSSSVLFTNRTTLQVYAEGSI